MEAIIEQCLNDGICASQAAFARDGGLHSELKDSMQDWAAGFSPPPTDEMVAAWLIGFSGVLSQHYEAIGTAGKTGAS